MAKKLERPVKVVHVQHSGSWRGRTLHWRLPRTTYQDSKTQSQKREEEEEVAQKDVEKPGRTKNYRKEKQQEALMELRFSGLEVQLRGKHTFIYIEVLDLFPRTKGNKEMGK